MNPLHKSDKSSSVQWRELEGHQLTMSSPSSAALESPAGIYGLSKTQVFCLFLCFRDRVSLLPRLWNTAVGS